MLNTVTRKELYELVWSIPRLQLAKRFGVSDVAVGKRCRQLNVPAPPPGYWAHVAAHGTGGRKYPRPPLSYSVLERIQEDHDSLRVKYPFVDGSDLNAPLPPSPEFAESVGSAIARYKAMVLAVPAPKSDRGLHPMLANSIKEDVRRVSLQDRWAQPMYQGQQGRLLLAAISRLAWWWSDLGFEPESSGTRHIHFMISLGYGVSVPFAFALADSDRETKPTASEGAHRFRFWLEADARYSLPSEKPTVSFSTFEPEVFLPVTMQVIEKMERYFRDWLTQIHSYIQGDRRRAIEAVRVAREAELKRLEDERKALEEMRARLMNNALDGMRRSDQIRELVDSIEHRGMIGQESRDVFERWKSWTLTEADSLDIRRWSPDAVSDWMLSFRLALRGSDD